LRRSSKGNDSGPSWLGRREINKWPAKRAETKERLKIEEMGRENKEFGKTNLEEQIGRERKIKDYNRRSGVAGN